MPKQRVRILLAMSFALVVLLFMSSSAVRAAAIVVNSLADTTAHDDLCTLREAIINANDNAATWLDCMTGSGVDTITFSVSGTIRLGSTLPEITDAAGLTINGAGQSITISGDSDGNGTPNVRLFLVGLRAALTLQNLSLTKAYSTGGSVVHNSGTTTVTNCAVSASYAANSGGAIYNGATLVISKSVFSGNSAHTGGAIYNIGDHFSVDESTFSANAATESGADGGAIFNARPSTVTNSLFSNNSATSLGGAVQNGSSLDLSGSTFSGNSAINGGGISIYSGTITVTESTLAGNTSSDSGGGIYGEGGTIVVMSSTFVSNTAAGFGGGLNGTGNILNSTFYSNTAAYGGGIAGWGNTNVTNVTLAGNAATVLADSAYTDNGTVTLRNSVLASEPVKGNCAGTVTNGGHNIDTGTTCGWGSSSGSMSNTNALLGPLSDNGGPTQTMALSAKSPAIDAGDPTVCTLAAPNGPGGVDQRGVPHKGICDVGAYEAGVKLFLSLLMR